MRFSTTLMLAGSVLLLVGCGGGAAEMMGLGRHSPDEFAVVDRAPLSMPPDYNLRPPQPGAPRPQEIEMDTRANDILFEGKDVRGNSVVSSSEQGLLEKAGADKADPSIRSVIDRESRERVVGTPQLVQELLWWRDPADEATVVDAKAEAERLRNAKANDEPLTKDPTPVIEKNRGGW